jgi:V/A-type H+/Na+-transporting ATPase subunit C
MTRADFAYGNTRLHARRGDLLRDADYERLLGQDADGILTALAATPYARDAEQARGDAYRRLHETIRLHLGRTLEEMRAFYADRARRLVDQLLARFDVHNVVTVLRAHASRRRRAEEAMGALFPVGWLTGPLAHEALAERELAGAVDLLIRRIPDREHAEALRAAYREYERTTDLPAFEHAVVADHAARADAALAAAGPEGRTLLRFARRAIDERNLLLALRLRDAPGEPSPAHALLAGGSVPPAAFDPALHAPAPGAAAAELGALTGGTWRPLLQGWAAGGDLPALERALERRPIADAAALFAGGDPLGIDVPIAFTAAKRLEARNLRLLAEAGARGLHPDTVRRELIWPQAPA